MKGLPGQNILPGRPYKAAEMTVRGRSRYAANEGRRTDMDRLS